MLDEPHSQSEKISNNYDLGYEDIAEDLGTRTIEVEPGRYVVVSKYMLSILSIAFETSFKELMRGMSRYFLGLQFFTFGAIAWMFVLVYGALAKNPQAIGVVLVSALFILVVGWIIILWGSSDMHQGIFISRFPWICWPLILSELGVVTCHAMSTFFKVPAARSVRLVLVLLSGVLLALLFEKLARPLGKSWRFAALTSATSSALALIGVALLVSKWKPLPGVAFLLVGMLLGISIIYWSCQSMLTWKLSRAFATIEYREKIIACYFLDTVDATLVEQPSRGNVFEDEDRKHRARPLEEL